MAGKPPKRPPTGKARKIGKKPGGVLKSHQSFEAFLE
jgi:hypothetical protein